MPCSANIFQLGTGSTDVSLNVMYDIRIQDVGLNINSSYKINSQNKDRYRYGNKLSLNTQLYHKFRLDKKWQLSPGAGLQYETAEKDINAGYKADISGGNILLGTIAVEAVYKNIMAGANLQTPLQQHLAGNMVQAKNRAMLHVAYVF